MVNGPGKEKNRNQFQIWFPFLEKWLRRIWWLKQLKKSQKIVENLGMQEWELEWILEHNNWGREFLDFKEF
jgi:hypothetical protein